ncbi:MAG: response regulator transcription factor [Cyclobacteriaceae bacterium]
MKILVVENEVIVADNIVKVLKSSGYQPMSPALNYDQAILQIEKERPDFLILDINLGKGRSGIDVARFLLDRHPAPFIFLTAYADPKTLTAAFETKPAGYLIKPFTKSDIKPSIEVALINYRLREKEQSSDQLELLTATEKDVIRLIAQNKTTKQIADELHVSVSTVKNHRHNICNKLNLPPSNNSLLSWTMSNHAELQSLS